PFDREVESDDRFVVDHDVGLVNVRALHGYDLVSGPIDFSLRDTSDELPSGALTQFRRVAGGKRNFGGPIQPEALATGRTELARLLDDGRCTTSEDGGRADDTPELASRRCD